MSRIDHRRVQSARNLRREKPTKRPYDRILVVCEGAKTEPNYFEEIRQRYRLPSADIRIIRSAQGTQPIQVVEAAIDEFLKTRAYEKVYAVFDRDDHESYGRALIRGTQVDKTLRNDERQAVQFTCVPSVPCFELWLLLHFQEVHAFGHRRDIFQSLRRHIPGYDKGAKGLFELTADALPVATARSRRLQERFTAETGTDPFTAVDHLVDTLSTIRG